MKRSRGSLYSVINFEFEVEVYKVESPEKKRVFTDVIQAKNLLEATVLLNQRLVRKGLRKFSSLTIKAFKTSALGEKKYIDIETHEEGIQQNIRKREELVKRLEENRDKGEISAVLHTQRVVEEVEVIHAKRRDEVATRKTDILKDISKRYNLPKRQVRN